MLYPLSYGGYATWERVPAASIARTRSRTVREKAPGDATLTRVTQELGRVLVVDDDEVIRRLIAVNLQLEGFDVSTAVDGQDCLEKVAEIASRCHHAGRDDAAARRLGDGGPAAEVT